MPTMTKPAVLMLKFVHEVPEAAVDVELHREEAEDLDGADEEADRHRQPGDGQVVIDLAHGVEERPPVGARS